VQTGGGPGDDGVGAPWVTWVLDAGDVVGDNNRDWVSPVGGKGGRVSVIRPASVVAGGHPNGRSGPPWRPVMLSEAALTVGAGDS
jgi:hypothetical protein